MRLLPFGSVLLNLLTFVRRRVYTYGTWYIKSKCLTEFWVLLGPGKYGGEQNRSKNPVPPPIRWSHRNSRLQSPDLHTFSSEILKLWFQVSKSAVSIVPKGHWKQTPEYFWREVCGSQRSPANSGGGARRRGVVVLGQASVRRGGPGAEGEEGQGLMMLPLWSHKLRIFSAFHFALFGAESCELWLFDPIFTLFPFGSFLDLFGPRGVFWGYF